MANTWNRTGTTWSQGLWGEQDSNAAEISSGVAATISLGTLVAYPEQGWGRDTWGFENWGESALTVVVDVESSGVATTGVGAISLDDMQIGLPGQEVTSSLGTPGLLFGSGDLSVSGVSATTSVGSIVPAIGVSLSGIGATTSVGSIAPADVMGLTGVEVTTSVGEMTVTPTELVDVTGVGATSSVGSITPDDMAIGLTAPSNLTGSVGSIAPIEMTIGLTGLSATVTLGEIGGPIAWNKVTPSQGGSWSKKTATQGGSWSKVTPP